ncbi:myosin-6-like [Argentina anserina]|uniref:myosin-6-like n=1 Tax=Argentina anserina TaxID=57926 RepID=UPI0021768C74|nr:myosin-6-like [Potentilla anserina]
MSCLLFLLRRFTQTFSSINVQLFNSLLLCRECCTLRYGEYLNSGLAKLELWCCQTKEEFAGSYWDELKRIRQVVNFLVIERKYINLCPILNVQQLYTICTLYFDDSYNSGNLSSDVISSMREHMIEDADNAVSTSLLLDDNSSIHFSVETSLLPYKRRISLKCSKHCSSVWPL